jgi:hypothetical protein
MKAVLSYVDSKTEEYSRLPLFAHLRDDSIPARDRLSFVPCLAHFVMSFADLYGLVLRETPPVERFQELVNAHTYEDGGHWKWFLADLASLGFNPTLTLSDSLRVIWGERTAKTRMLTYRMCRLGLGASSLEKLVLVHCIEAAGKVSLAAAAPVATEVGKTLGRNLLYFGNHHLDTEQQHTLEDDAVHRSLESVSLDSAKMPALFALIDEAFAAFSEFSHELLTFSLADEATNARGKAT